MKLASVELRGKKTFGAIVADGFVDLGARLGASCPDLIGLFETEALARAQALAQGPADARLDELVYRPVNPRRDMRMFALGWAYKAHQLEAGKEELAHPNMFSKHPQSLVGHGQPIVRPRHGQRRAPHPTRAGLGPHRRLQHRHGRLGARLPKAQRDSGQEL